MSSRATDTRDGDETFLYQEARIQALQAALKKRETVLGVEAEDFENDLSVALDKFPLEFQEREPEAGLSGGFYMDDEYSVSVHLRGYEAIPTSHVFTYRRAATSDDTVEVGYKVRLISFNCVTEVAVYECKEI